MPVILKRQLALSIHAGVALVQSVDVRTISLSIIIQLMGEGAPKNHNAAWTPGWSKQPGASGGPGSCT